MKKKHKQIPEYTIQPSEPSRRQCSINDFLYETPEDQDSINIFNCLQYSHTMFRIQESDLVRQVVPSLKEVINWTNEHPTLKTNTIYLEVIPGKPDNKDTIMYALNRLEDLFIFKLGYRKLIISGDAKVYDVIWKIKAEYGSSMDWIEIVLGTWHTLRDFLQHLCKKYQHAFLEKVLSAKYNSTSIESLINVKNWTKSHNAMLWILESLLRMLIESYEKSPFCKDQKLAELKKKLQKV